MRSGSVPPPVTERSVLAGASVRLLPAPRARCGARPTRSGGGAGRLVQTTGVAVGCRRAALGAGVRVGVAVRWVVGRTGTLVGVAPGGTGVVVAGSSPVPLRDTIWGLS